MDAIILCGGVGTRLWPLSRAGNPKHFLSLTGDRSLVQETYRRLEPLADRIWAVAPLEQHAELQRQLPDLPKERIVPEPAARGTAAAIGLAVWRISEQYQDAVIGSFHADHLIPDQAAFERDIRETIGLAQMSDKIVLLGLTPTYPSTGFGYIHRGEALRGSGYLVEAFKEKPDATLAAKYMKSGGYYWNLGMFIAKASTFKEEIEAYLPGWGEAFDACLSGRPDEYLKLEREAIDTAVIERSKRVAVIGARFPWSDVGSFADLYGALIDQAGENVEVGEVQTVDARGNLLFSSGRLIAAIGVEDLVVVETPEAVLICPREKSQDVKQLVESLSEDRR